MLFSFLGAAIGAVDGGATDQFAEREVLVAAAHGKAHSVAAVDQLHGHVAGLLRAACHVAGSGGIAGRHKGHLEVRCAVVGGFGAAAVSVDDDMLAVGASVADVRATGLGERALQAGLVVTGVCLRHRGAGDGRRQCGGHYCCFDHPLSSVARRRPPGWIKVTAILA